MTDLNHFTFDHLGNKNYTDDFDLRMEAALVRKQLWGVIQVLVSKTKSDGTTKMEAEMVAERNGLVAAQDVAKMAEARAEPILCVKPSQLSHITSRDLIIIWWTLERMHCAAGFATSLALRCQFLTARKLDSETMEAWIGCIQSTVLHKEYTGVMVTDQNRILALTMGLPATYEAVAITFDSTSSEHLRWEQSKKNSTETATAAESDSDSDYDSVW